MNYCMECGTKLERRLLEKEGQIPYCPHCHAYRFPPFSVAVSMIALHPDRKKILLIKQYEKAYYILPAGYVNQKETLEQALYRECQEELGRTIVEHRYLRSAYYPPTNTLLCNYVVVLDDACLLQIAHDEVKEAKWFEMDAVLTNMQDHTLAKQFVEAFLKDQDKK